MRNLLLDLLVNRKKRVEKLVVASSMSVYGEGKYLCEDCGPVYPQSRDGVRLRKGEWEMTCPKCQKTTAPSPTDEEKPLTPVSIYAQSKRHQEEMCLLVGKTYSIPTVALRYFNVYGPRQSLANPYTGVCALFSARILNNKPPYIFEDGKQVRDFVNVKDVAEANILAIEKDSADYMAVNIGTGRPISINELAEKLIELYGADVDPIISRKYREGDIRHAYADITTARRYLGYEPKISLDEGMRDLTEWAKAHGWAAKDLFDKAMEELKQKKLA
jgi:dTDP-L-rhamnose 4-epimerase